jgi:hypothetical protein
MTFYLANEGFRRICFLLLAAPILSNLGMRFSLRGDGYHTPCYGFSNHLH